MPLEAKLGAGCNLHPLPSPASWFPKTIAYSCLPATRTLMGKTRSQGTSPADSRSRVCPGSEPTYVFHPAAAWQLSGSGRPPRPLFPAQEPLRSHGSSSGHTGTLPFLQLLLITPWRLGSMSGLTDSHLKERGATPA